MINQILSRYLNNEKTGRVTNYSLAGITLLMELLGNPHKNFKSVHIAGTNGKGTTAYLLSAVLEKSGYKTGLYTSPHLLKINERIKINSGEIDDNTLYDYISRIDRIVSDDNGISITYFDLLTAAAFLYFNESGVDIAVIEAGLGGRLDSTNIIIPEVSIITDISYDHMQVLGNTLEEITGEKCGIIKDSVPVVTSNSETEIIDIIKAHACNHNSEMYAFNHDFSVSDLRRENDRFIFSYKFKDLQLRGVNIRLFPRHQVKNTSVALTALRLLKDKGYYKIKDDIICNTLENIQVPGRFQVLNENPLIVYDPAHNYGSLKNLTEGLDLYYAGKKKLFIISMMKDKAYDNTLEVFEGREVIFFVLNDERAYTPDRKKFSMICTDEKILAEILKKRFNPDEMIIFTGTFRIYNHAVNVADTISEY